MSASVESPKPAVRFDPYKNFRFRLKWDGRYVAGVSGVSGLKQITDVIKHRPGGDPSTPTLLPGQSEYSAITLERGVTHDAAFDQWANKVWDYPKSTTGDGQADTGNLGVPLEDFRKDIVLELYNEAGQKVIVYNIYRCWPLEFTATPDLDGNGDAVAIESLRLANEGWERDTSATESTESWSFPA